MSIIGKHKTLFLLFWIVWGVSSCSNETSVTDIQGNLEVPGGPKFEFKKHVKLDRYWTEGYPEYDDYMFYKNDTAYYEYYGVDLGRLPYDVIKRECAIIPNVEDQYIMRTYKLSRFKGLDSVDHVIDRI